MASTWDPRFGPGWPYCSRNKGRVTVRLDFGLGHSFEVEYQSGAVAPLLRAVAKIKSINEAKDDPRIYLVHEVGHNHSTDVYNVQIAGTYACRPMNNPNVPDAKQKASLHSLPLAIDVNPSTNGFGSHGGDHPTWFRQAFLDEGFTWGGEWDDPMHYEQTKWYGEWDGTYPEEDELTPDEKQTLEDAKEFLAAAKGGTHAKTMQGLGERVAKAVKHSEGDKPKP